MWAKHHRMSRAIFVSLMMGLMVVTGMRSARAAELLFNPGFEDLNADTIYGDGWGKFGNTDFNAFFGPGNGHASLFADTIGNSGGVYQQGIAGGTGVHYQFTLTDTLIEENWDARFRFGLEYYAGDDSTKLGEDIGTVDTTNPINRGSGLSFPIDGFAAVGTVFVRPIIEFDNVNTTGGSSRNAFVFAASLEALPEPASFGIVLAGSMLVLSKRRRS